MARNRDHVRLSSIELLPREADEDVSWIIDQIVVRRGMTQFDGYAALKERLDAKGIKAPAFSSFNRFILDIRENGVPPRYRPTAPDATPSGRDVTGLLALIDSRIELALAHRFPREGR